MPTSGTHITIVQRIAADPTYTPLLGNPDPTLPETDPAAIKMRYACLGSVGPDIFYAMADYGSELQDLENYLVKIGGPVEALAELMGKIDRYISGIETVLTQGVIDSLKTTSTLVTGVFNEGILALLASGVNLWPVFEPARQRDLPRDHWYWADYFHYIRSGRFVQTLLKKSAGNPNLQAYAFGYLTHYVTDVVGHPYVNQVVGAPWRLAWQRHHLVENFMDAYVWDRWHTSLPLPPPPSTAEQPLDKLVSTPNPTGTGAPFTFARINDWMNVGTISVGDPVDSIIDAVADKVNQGLFDIGVVEDMDPAMPADADFKAWTAMMAAAIKETYNEDPPMRPMNLSRGVLPGGVSRPDGYPTAEDVGAAYGIFRVVMKIGTEEKIKKPVPPDILSDITAAVNQLMNQIAADLGGIPPPPSIPMGGSFSLSAIVNALINAAAWAAKVAAAVTQAATDFLTAAVQAGTTVTNDAIKYVFYLLNTALFAMYRSLRDVLVLQAYSPPYTEEISGMIGSLDATTLWRSLGNPPAASFPPEELVVQRQKFLSGFSPAVPPTSPPERPTVAFVAPYGPTPGTRVLTVAPDAFIDAPLGTTDLFQPTSPRAAATAGTVETFADGTLNFGGAIANSKRGIDLVQAGFPGGTTLPDYNLDGDRGYAWPCWDVRPAPTPTTVNDPLAPDAPQNVPAGVATVHAVIAPS